MRLRLRVELTKIDGSSGERPTGDVAAGLLRDEVDSLEIWHGDYGMSVSVIEGPE